MLTKLLTRPTLLLDKKRCLQNIERMAQKAASQGLVLRPHFKTAQSKKVGNWFRDFGVRTITVSSIRMAEYFAEDGWNDITIAFPHNLHETDRLISLAEQTQINIVAENIESLQPLTKRLKHPIQVMIKADCGYHRTGLSIQEKNQIDRLIEFIEQHPPLSFRGFLTHSGHSYKVRGKQEIAKIHHESITEFAKFRAEYEQAHPKLWLSYGDTPTCSAMDHFDGVNELRPGNFVFYDLSQWHIGSCNLDQIAVAMACPVVAKHPQRREVIIYGGGVHFSKDRVKTLENMEYYGLVVEADADSWQVDANAPKVVSLSQEHGTVKGSVDWLEKVKIGDWLYILPVHSCMTADLMKEYLTTEGEWIRDVLRLE